MGLRLHRRGRIWHVKIYIDGLEIRKSLKTTSKSEAEARASRLYAEIQTGAAQPARLGPAITLSKFKEEYLKFIKEAKTKSAKTIEIDGYALAMLCEQFGDRPIRSISTADVESALSDYLAGGKSASSRNMMLRHLKAIFSKGIEWGSCRTNPCKGIKQIKIGEKPIRALSDDQVEALIKAAEAHSVELYRYCVLGIYAGLRKKELSFIRWENLDFAARLIRVENTEAFTTKSRRQRAIPMHDRIAAWKDDAGSGYIFSGERPDWKGHYRYDPRKAFASIGKSAELPEDCSPHWMRHTFATRCLRAGISIYEVQKFCGHSSIQVTERYLHLLPQEGAEKINRLK